MIRITELQLPLDHPPEALRAAIIKRLKIKSAELEDFTVFKRSYDARKKSTTITFVYIIDVNVTNEAALLEKLGDDKHINPAPDTNYYPVAKAPANLSERPRPALGLVYYTASSKVDEARFAAYRQQLQEKLLAEGKI